MPSIQKLDGKSQDEKENGTDGEQGQTVQKQRKEQNKNDRRSGEADRRGLQMLTNTFDRSDIPLKLKVRA